MVRPRQAGVPVPGRRRQPVFEIRKPRCGVVERRRATRVVIEESCFIEESFSVREGFVEDFGVFEESVVCEKGLVEEGCLIKGKRCIIKERLDQESLLVQKNNLPPGRLLAEGS